MTRVYLRWVPAAVVTTVIAAGALAVPLQAGAAVDLPDKTPQEVLELVGESAEDSFSGTIEQTSDLGLPDISAGGSSAGGASGDELASALELLTGDHTARVYVDGHDKKRVQVMDRMAERDLIVNGYDVWLWDSQENTATHVVVPPHDTADFPKSGDTRTPAELAEKFLEKVDPTTEVTVDDDTEVAGRAAYDLVLTPRSSEDTLVGSVRIAVDSETGLPLRVQVTARGETEPAFRLAFTELSLETPDADIFEFEPPPGATVEEQELPTHPPRDGKSDGDHGDFPGEVSGSGWDTVIELPAGSAPAELTESPLFAQATEAVDEGQALSTTLLTILITDDGRVYAGSVPLERLQSAAADG